MDDMQYFLDPDDGKKHTYIFRYTDNKTRGAREMQCKTHECYQSEIPEVEERLAAEIERESGNRVYCVDVTEYQDNYKRGMER